MTEEQAHKKRWPELEALLDELMDATAQEQADRLAALEKADPELATAARRMLDAMDNEDSLLEQGAAAISGALARDLAQQVRAAPGAGGSGPTALGPYRLIKTLGRGGMADVWLAERNDEVLQQKVAIKVLHPLTGADALERFRSERQILGALRHDGIAKILDAGTTTSGTAYLVLEYVEDGTHITDYCRMRKLGLRQRLELFREVCDAVAYAHRRLIVHRDLKPSNILVNRAGSVKLVDFGIAKLLDPEIIALADAPQTRTGLFLMTPEYAAPEQIRGETITTATDVYGLGALLFELLTGRRPFATEGKTAREIEQLVCETEPERPSTNSTRGSDTGIPDTHNWTRELRGDLDTIALKALRKEPEARYATVQDLSEDVGRFLQGRPVAARPATLGYRFGKFVQRNRLPVAAAGLVSVAVVGGVVATAWQANAARQEAARAQAIGDFLFELFEGADPESNPGQPLTALDLVDAGAEQVDRLNAGPRAEVDMLRVLGTLYGKLGESEKGEDFLRRAAAQAQRDLPARSATRQEAGLALAQHLAELGDPIEAERILRELGENSDADAAEIRTWTGVALMKRGQYEAAEAALRQALAASATPEQLDAARMELGNLLINQERWDEAEATLREVLVSREAALGRNHVDVAVVLWNLSELMLKTARFAEAEEAHREILAIRRNVYPNGHPDIARSLGQIGAAVQRQGRFEEAGELYEQAVAAWDARFGRANPNLGEILTNLAALRYRLGDIPGAVQVQTEAQSIWRAVWGDQDDNLVAAGLNNLGVMHRELGNYADADRYFNEALAMRRRLHGDGHATVGMSLANLGRLRMLEGRLEAAEPYALEALEICTEQLPAGHPALLAAQMAAGAVLSERGRPEDALPLLGPVAEAYADLLPPTDARLAETHLWLGVTMKRLGQSEARNYLTKANQVLTDVLGADAALTRRAREELAAL